MKLADYLVPIAYLFVLFTVVLLLYKFITQSTDGFSDSGSSALQQVVALSNARMSGRQSMELMLSHYTSSTTPDAVPEEETSLVNFYTLGCRFAGYLGPYKNGELNPDKAVKYAVDMGCRTFILEIGYIPECGNFYPRVMIRNVQGIKLQSAEFSPNCEGDANSTIKAVATALKKYALDDPTNQGKGPLILVLYVLEAPPSDPKEPDRLLKYYSKIAEGLQPLVSNRVTSMANGGNFSRQQQEGVLLANNIRDYDNSVIVMSNADTSDFRNPPPSYNVAADADLDNWVNLRLTSYSQTKLGVTTQSTTAQFGILDTVQSFLGITSEKVSSIVKGFNPTWTLCMETDPEKATTPEDFQKLTSTFGINCIPIQIWNPSYDFLYAKKTGLFESYSFVPKPASLRYRKPPIMVAGAANPAMNANEGRLKTPAARA